MNEGIDTSVSPELRVGDYSLREFVDYTNERKLGIDDLQRVAHWYLRVTDNNLRKNGRDGLVGQELSWESVSHRMGYDDRLRLQQDIYGHARRKERLEELSLGIVLATNEDKRAEFLGAWEYEDSRSMEARGYFTENGVKKADFKCGYCGSVQEVDMLEGSVAHVGGCGGCGQKMEFIPPERPETVRDKKRNLMNIKTEEEWRDKVEAKKREIEGIDLEDRRSRGELRDGLLELKNLYLMEGYDLDLWAARAMIRLRKEGYEKYPISKLPFEDIGGEGHGGRMRETLIKALKVTDDDLKKVRDIMLMTVEPRNNRDVLADSRNPNVQVLFCHDCGDVFKQDITGAEFEDFSVVDNTLDSGFDLRQFKCACGSCDVHHSYDPSPNVRLGEDFSRGDLEEFIVTHFTSQELEYLFATSLNGNIQNIGAETLSKNVSEIIRYAERRHTLPKLAETIQEFRHRSGLEGRSLNIACPYCRTVDTRFVDSEGCVLGGCNSCGGKGAEVVTADLSIVEETRITTMPERKLYDVELTDVELERTSEVVSSLTEKENLWRAGVVTLSMVGREDYTRLIQSSDKFRNYYDEVLQERGRVGYLHLQSIMFARAVEENNLKEFLGLFVERYPAAFLSRYDRIDREIKDHNVQEFNRAEKRVIVALVDPELFSSVDEKELKVTSSLEKDRLWDSAMTQIEGRKELKQVENYLFSTR